MGATEGVKFGMPGWVKRVAVIVPVHTDTQASFRRHVLGIETTPCMYIAGGPRHVSQRGPKQGVELVLLQSPKLKDTRIHMHASSSVIDLG